MTPISLDFETFYSPKYSVRTMVAEEYCRDPRFEAYMISVSDGETSWAGEPKDFNWDALNGRTLLSHNSYFDSTVLAEMQRRGLAPKLDIPEWHCTANLTSYVCNRRALAQAVERLYGRKVSKEARTEARGLHWSDFMASEKERMLKYALGDARDCWQLWHDYSPCWPEWERRLSELTIRQAQRGFQVNTSLLDDYILWTHEAKMATEKLLPWLEDTWDDSDEFNQKPTSTKCIAEQCHRAGIPCPPVKSDDEDAYYAWEAVYAPNHAWVLALSSWRSINKLYKTFMVMKARLRDDGTMPFGLKYFGAHTGRWSGDAQINVQNPRKLPLLIRRDRMMESDDARTQSACSEHAKTGKWPDWVLHAIDFRALIIPRPGKKMIVCDLAQIEPRVLNWLAGNHEFLQAISGGMAVYEAHARATMGWTGGKLRDEDPQLYALAKARVLALGYQAGWEKFIAMAKTLTGLDLTKDDPEWEVEPGTNELVPDGVPGHGMHSRQWVAQFREQNPRIVDLWGRLDAGFKSSVGGDYEIELPSGRVMRYEAIRCDTHIEPDAKTKKPTRKSVYTADVGGRRFPFYGGKLTENITQATARDVFGQHLLALDELERNCVLFSVHDEAVVEVDAALTTEDIERTMSVCPPWLDGCPIGAEAMETPCYTK